MRLTCKTANGYCDMKAATREKKLNKLGQLEDIEDEFEIDDLKDLRDRLTTYKFLANHEMSCVDVNAYNLMLKDLDEYHKIEEELGIDLITLFKLINAENVYSYGHTNIMKNTGQVNIYNRTITIWNGSCHQIYPLREYGKSFALTKEELE